ncbi:hypothetical protein ACJIZ3_019696 [Penstemon smallii]|uniref:Uncharacterized protein n=1 Tax=Penstemon smallii TaxID=265156 RepID=A0ABD3T1X3_9LAMI
MICRIGLFFFSVFRCFYLLLLSEKTSEKNNKIISELNKKIGILKNQIVERDQSIGTLQEKLMQIHDLKELKLDADRKIEDMRREKSEADQKIEELRRRNSEAVETIEGLRREKSEADQTVEQLRRQNDEAVETIEVLRREKSKAHQMVVICIFPRKTTEDIETIKRLRREISTVNREKMSSDQTRAETSSKNSEEADEEMKQLRKRNFEASETIGQLRRRKVIAAEMGKMISSDHQIVKEMKQKLLFQNMENLNRQISAAVETEKTKSDKTPKETTNKQSEVDQTVDQLRRRNMEASQIIVDLKSQISAAEGDKKKSDQTLDEMKNKQLEVDLQIVKELKRKYSEALQKIEELVIKVDKKRSANMESRLKRLEEGFANIKKVKVGNLDNVGKSDDKFGTTKKVEDVSMHACSGPSKIERNANNINSEINSNDRGNGGNIFKGGREVNCPLDISQGVNLQKTLLITDSDDEISPGGSKGEMKKKFNEQFLSSSQTLKRRKSSLENDSDSVPCSIQKKKPKPENL